MCTILVPPGVNPTALNKYIYIYIISYHTKFIFSAALSSRVCLHVTMAFHYGTSISTKALMLMRILRLSKRCSWIPLLLGYRHLLLDVCCPTSNWTMKWKDSTRADLQQVRTGTADWNAFYSAELNFTVVFPQHLTQLSKLSPQWALGPPPPGGDSGRVLAVTTNPHVASRLKKAYSYTSTPTLDLRGLF
jgi:hypothetical protein